MRFGLLGSLEVIDQRGQSLDVGGAQPRTVLAALLVASARVVTADALVDAVWGDKPPASAAGTLQSYISRLRRRFGEDAGLLVFEPPGYRLTADGEDVDFRRFEALADQGRALLADGKADEARDVLVAADALWRGAALVEFADLDFASGLARRLEDRRLAAIEDRIAADLLLGRHAAVVGELGSLVGEQPLQEGLRGHLALALYRSGRQAEALRAIDDARRMLRDELGVDLSRPLQELEAAILDHDQSLELDREPSARANDAPLRPAARIARQGDVDREGGLVGRRMELAGLVGALEEARTSTRVVIVEGEPGIGKTRLAEETAAEAAANGATVLWGRAFEGGAAPAFWPWLPPLRALAASLPNGIAPAAEVLSLLAPTGADPEGPAAAEPARFALFEGVVGLLSAAAADRPVVVVLDDVQWADEASLELLVSLTGRLVDAPLLVLCTVRELEVGRNDAVVDALATLTRRPTTRRLRLRGLSSDETAVLVAQTTGQPVDHELVDAIHGRAEGNPFFTTELARLLATGAEAKDVPSGVRDVVRRRLALLPEPTSTLLQVAAVIGRDVDLPLLTATSGRDLDKVLDDLEPALVHRLLVDAPDHPSAYRFAHALVREVVVDDMSTLRRARLHLKVADALDDRDDNAEILAEHLWAAVPIGVGERAADALERAARVAERRLAYSSAKDLLHRAVQLRRAAGAEVEEVRALAELVAVTAAHVGYPSLVASPLIARGKQLAAQTGQQFELLNLLWAEWAALDLSLRSEQAHRIAAELVERFAGSEVALGPVLAHTAHGIALWHQGRISESAEHLDAAKAAAAQIPFGGRASVLFDVHQIRLSVPFGVYVHDLIGDLHDADASYAEAARLIPGDPVWELVVANFEASASLLLGDLQRSIRAARRGITADPQGVSAFWSVAARGYLGAALCLGGDVDEGLPIFKDAWAQYIAMGPRTNGVAWLSSCATGLARAARLDEAQAYLEEAQHELRTYGEGYGKPVALIAEAAIAHGRNEASDGVRATLLRARDLATEQGAHAVAQRVTREAADLGIPL